MAFLGCVVLTLPIQYNWPNYTHVRDWTPVSAKVVWLGGMCEMHYSAGKHSVLRDVIDCKSVKPWRVANKTTVNGRQQYFRSTPTAYAILLVSTENGAMREVKVRQSVASRDKVVVGDVVQVVHDPANPSRIDRAYQWYEYKYSILYYAALVWMVQAFVRFAIRERRKLKEAKIPVSEAKRA
jgi:hypothetical protein